MPDPFDPVRGAWVLLLALVGIVALGQVLVFAGCLLGAEAFCTRNTENLTSVSVEVLAAVAILIGIGKK